MKNMTETKKIDGLKIALPNGSLEEGTLRLFEDANLKIWKDSRKHDAWIDDSSISQATFMRPQVAPRLVENGLYDVAICGLDCVIESGANVAVVGELPYGRGSSMGRTQVVLFTAREISTASIEDVPKNSRVITEYPNITMDAFQRAGILVQIEFSHGGTEALVPKYAPYGVCVSDTGKSLEANVKKVIKYLSASFTALIANHQVLEEKTDAVKALYLHLSGTLRARGEVLLKMNVAVEKKEAVLAVLQALKTPTVASLADGTSFAIETVVPREEANILIIRAARAGAEGILELPITKLIPKW